MHIMIVIHKLYTGALNFNGNDFFVRAFSVNVGGNAFTSRPAYC